jgi:hypothetical protein
MGNHLCHGFHYSHPISEHRINLYGLLLNLSWKPKRRLRWRIRCQCLPTSFKHADILPPDYIIRIIGMLYGCSESPSPHSEHRLRHSNGRGKLPIPCRSQLVHLLPYRVYNGVLYGQHFQFPNDLCVHYFLQYYVPWKRFRDLWWCWFQRKSLRACSRNNKFFESQFQQQQWLESEFHLV